VIDQIQENIVDLAKSRVQEIFEHKNFEHRYYHSFVHSSNVRNNAVDLAKGLGLSDKDQQLLSLAAYFHDTGFSNGEWNGHEDRSAIHAREFLSEHKYSESDISRIESLIQSTKMDVEASDLLERLMKDADTSHIGSKEYQNECSQLRLEWESAEGKVFTEEQWYRKNLEFLKNHTFLSPIAKQRYNSRKFKNIANMESDLIRTLDYEKKALIDQEVEDPYTNQTIKPSRGIETMYRVALRNHNQLSKIADNKANILLSITSLMMSIVISSLASKLDANTTLIIPTIILLVVCLITMIFSILATRPNITEGNFNRKDFLNNKINILFFGNFYKMPLDEFQWGMDRLQENDKLLYGSLTKDLYFLGVVLQKKYMLLRRGYNIFMIGMIISALAFMLTFYFTNLPL